MTGADGASGGAPLQQQAVVGPAQQLVLPQGELVPGQQLPAAHRAAETLDVVDVLARSHHQVAAAEAQVAFGAFNSEEPAEFERSRPRVATCMESFPSYNVDNRRIRCGYFTK